jgi:hypothetical protein
MGTPNHTISLALEMTNGAMIASGDFAESRKSPACPFSDLQFFNNNRLAPDTTGEQDGGFQGIQTGINS